MNVVYYWLIFIFISFSPFYLLVAQEIIPISNRSFEETIFTGVPDILAFTSLNAWQSIGPEIESPPDLFTSKFKAWGVESEAHHGENFIGLVTRPNGTYELITQRLENQLKKSQEYELHIFLCMSESYQSYTQENQTSKTDFTNPVSLIVGVSNEVGKEISYLSISPPVHHSEWKRYVIKIIPDKDYKLLVLGAHLPEGTTELLAGNILIDNITLIKMPE